ncbi:MAG: chemoreceptor glutamine deamidase CheD [Gammaproteobacteria bacterium]
MRTSPARRRCEPTPALRGFEQINRYWDDTHGVIAAKILPGEYYVTCSDEVIVTVLGSCISACVRDPIAGVGGMNHFMLPSSSQAGSARWSGLDLSDATRYGNYAMEHMINDILKHGGRRERLEVKIVGGGRIISNMSDVGRRNIEFVEQYLCCEGLRVVGRDVGGLNPRKVYYWPLSGAGKVKKLVSLHNATILDRENRYMHAIQDRPVAGEVELFD